MSPSAGDMQDIALCVEKAKLGLATLCVLWEDAAEDIAARLTDAVGAP